MYLINISIFSVVSIIAVSCHNSSNPKLLEFEANSIDTIERDIPKNARGELPSYYFEKPHVESLLALPTLEKGFDSLQIRIWAGYAGTDSSQLVILKSKDGRWDAEFYELCYYFTTKRDSIISIAKTVRMAVPASGWASLSGRIVSYNITRLPDMGEIKDYPTFADGDGIVVEVVTKNKYRIYAYSGPEIAADLNIMEAKKLTEFLTYIENEFHFRRLRKYQKKLINKKIIKIPAIYGGPMKRPE